MILEHASGRNLKKGGKENDRLTIDLCLYRSYCFDDCDDFQV
jgi:hypothetical protein